MVTYPPEMLPRADGPAEVIVCAEHANCVLAERDKAVVKFASQEIDAALDVADIARDLVLMWDHQKVAGLPRSERNAAIDDIRKRLTEAVHEWETLRKP